MKNILLISLMIISNSIFAGVYKDPGGFIYPEYTSKKFILKKDIEVAVGKQVVTIGYPRFAVDKSKKLNHIKKINILSCMLA